MRTIKEIKAEIEKETAPAFKRILTNELIGTITNGIPLPDLEAWAEAYRDNRAVVLPCKVGDTVYWFWCDSEGNADSDLYEKTVLYLDYDKDGVGIATKYYDGHIGHFKESGAISDGVRRIFLTRPEAEAALRKEK